MGTEEVKTVLKRAYQPTFGLLVALLAVGVIYFTGDAALDHKITTVTSAGYNDALFRSHVDARVEALLTSDAFRAKVTEVAQQTWAIDFLKAQNTTAENTNQLHSHERRLAAVEGAMADLKTTLVELRATNQSISEDVRFVKNTLAPKR